MYELLDAGLPSQRELEIPAESVFDILPNYNYSLTCSAPIDASLNL